MTETEKVKAALKLISNAGIKDERTNANEVYEQMRSVTLIEIAEVIADSVNLVYDLRDILEDCQGVKNESKRFNTGIK